MRKRFLCCLLITGFLAVVSGDSLWAAPVNFAQKRNGGKTKMEEPLKTLTVGETLTFEVFWMGIPVGLGTLEVKEKVIVRGREAFHVVAIAKTNDFLSKIYPIYDEVHSFIDAEKFCSLEFSKELREGRYRSHERVIYDYGRKKGLYESFLSKKKTEIDIPSEVQDAVSAFFWFRLQDVQVGKSLKTVVNSREQNWDLEIKVLGNEAKELRGGKIVDTVLVEPKTRYKEILYQRGRAWVYFSADRKRLPVWINIKTPFGPVNGVLKDEFWPQT